MSVTDDAPLARRLGDRLAELGIETTDREVEELASAHAALEAWIRITGELAQEQRPAPPEPPST